MEEKDLEISALRTQLFVAESVIAEYRQALADAQFALAKSNASGKCKDQQIKSLEIGAAENT